MRREICCSRFLRGPKSARFARAFQGRMFCSHATDPQAPPSSGNCLREVRGGPGRLACAPWRGDNVAAAVSTAAAAANLGACTQLCYVPSVSKGHCRLSAHAEPLHRHGRAFPVVSAHPRVSASKVDSFFRETDGGLELLP